MTHLGTPPHSAGAARSADSVLVLGSTGTTGRRVVAGLRAEGVPVRAATRSPRAPAEPGLEHVRFDWDDPAGHDAALRGSRAVYVLGPLVSAAPEAVVIPFIDRALALGIRRLVLLSASAIRPGDPGLGLVHQHLAASEAEWAVLRPTWFAQNLLDPTHHIGAAVLAGDDIVTATGQGRIGFVDAADIAAVAVRALLDPVPHRTDHLVTGPEALTYDDAAAALTAALGRPVRHRAATADEAESRMVGTGMPRAYASILAAMEVAIAGGSESHLTDAVLRVTGHPPTPLAGVLDATLAADGLRAGAKPASPTVAAR